MAQDRGLGAERTALAWQRTALALAAAAAVMARLTFGRLGWVAVAVLAVAMVLAVGVFGQSSRRSGTTPRGRSHHPMGKGAPALFLAGTMVILAVVELVAIAVTRT